jgi:hypothetical protein
MSSGIKGLSNWVLLFVVIVAVALQGSISQADLIGWWKLDDGEGATVADSSPSGTTGQITNFDTGGLGDAGSVWTDDATRGTVISFDGEATGAYVRIGSIPQMTLDNDFTWAFWANQDAGNTTPNDILFGNRYDEAAADFVPRQFIKFTPTQFEFHMNGNGDDNVDYIDIEPDVWIQHTVVKSGSELTYYRDGEVHYLDENQTATGTITQPLDFPQPLFLGGNNSGDAGENWRGMLSDVRIYDNALSAEEVRELVDGVVDPIILGDVNLDKQVNGLDVDPFVGLVTGGTFQAEGDMNGDGVVNGLDVDPFVAAVVGVGTAEVPEPSTLALLGISLLGLLLCRRPARA